MGRWIGAALAAGLLSRAAFGFSGDDPGSIAPADAPLDRSAALAALDERTVGVAARFVAISSGTFLMGGDAGEPYRPVTLTRGFEMQATVVTQEQYELVMGRNPSHFGGELDCSEDERAVIAGRGVCMDNPVENVSWNDVQSFIARINAVQDKHVYRLPTEAEWEYAARAGGGFQGGAWTSETSGGRTHAVAIQEANAWGLYDMLGNVLEWTQDAYVYGDYPGGASVDPQGPSAGSFRVQRGSSWDESAAYASPARLAIGQPDGHYRSLGFRLVRTAR